MDSRSKFALGIVMTMVLITATDAYAQDIESLVMPGAVIEGHADIETECSSCHKMFDKKGQKQLCMDCHEDVALDVELGNGYHGMTDTARNSQCADCHTDHEGRDARIVILDETSFDHAFTDFELVGSHAELECNNCHTDDSKHRDAPGTCIDCHEADEPHRGAMGTACADCHSPTNWNETSFDHESTGYTLLGQHAEAACLDCHDDQTFGAAPTECFACHADDDAHDGRSGEQCGDCHNPSDWHDSSFDHARDTEFPLEASHGLLACGDCHSENPFDDDMNMACLACHIEDDAHAGHHGEECGNCHASDDWAEPIFEHDRDTDYDLIGGHVEVDCVNCHVEPIFDTPLQASCDTCHLDDDPHDGSMGTSCQDCHTEITWADPVFFDHDLTLFPLLGAHKENECEDCHASKAFAETDAACVSCHRDDDEHDGNFHERCDSCHNPVGWEFWLFDHDALTGFLLDGAHSDVECADCHRMPLVKVKAIDGNCAICHRADDIHDGEFGADCGRCHSSDTFREVRSLQ